MSMYICGFKNDFRIGRSTAPKASLKDAFATLKEEYPGLRFSDVEFYEAVGPITAEYIDYNIRPINKLPPIKDIK